MIEQRKINFIRKQENKKPLELSLRLNGFEISYIEGKIYSGLEFDVSERERELFSDTSLFLACLITVNQDHLIKLTNEQKSGAKIKTS